MGDNIVKKSNNSSIGYEYFDKGFVPAVKGFAIIFMFMLHLLQTRWMVYPELIVDIEIDKTTLSNIIAQGGDICIGIFAFVSGYGWYANFDKKTKTSRIFGIGGVYSVYWFVLIIFAFPARVLFSFLQDGFIPKMTVLEVIKGIAAISSKSVRFQWYVYFFAMAVLTYKTIVSAISRIKINPVVLIYAVCLLFFGVRVASRIMFTRIISSNTLLTVFSHYCQWMPVIISGHITNRFNLYEKFFDELSRRRLDKDFGIISLIGVIIIYSGKCGFIFLTGIESNFDFLIMFPFMFFLIGLAGWIQKKTKIVKLLLEKLGAYSNYLWLTHSLMLYPIIQSLVWRLRLPVLILFVSFLVMFPIAFIIRNIDMQLRDFVVRNMGKRPVK